MADLLGRHAERDAIDHLFAEALEMAEPDWLIEARRLWSTPADTRARVAVPIWRDPWMVVGSRNYTTDLLAGCGLANVFGSATDRYPTVSVEEIEYAAAEVVLLPDEPYAFTEDDGPESFTTPTQLVSGRLLTWYGPAMVEAYAELTGWAG